MVILLGAPGSGKSTQGQFLVKRGKLRWLSMGDILRSNVVESKLRQLSAGQLLDDALAIKLLNEQLNLLGDQPELIIDGFPRSRPQSQWLLDQSRAGRFKISAVIHLAIPKNIAKQRLTSRGRPDDKVSTIAKRFDAYETTSRPVIAIMQAGGIPILEIDANQSIAVIAGKIITALKRVGVEA